MTTPTPTPEQPPKLKWYQDGLYYILGIIAVVAILVTIGLT